MTPKAKIKSNLIIFFLLAVIIPSILLSIFSISSINKEEAFVEKQFRNSLSGELNQLLPSIKNELKSILLELNIAIDFYPENDVSIMTSKWQRNSSLVKIPFILSSSKNFIWPDNSTTSTKKSRIFAAATQAFFKDAESITTLKDISSGYTNETGNHLSNEEQNFSDKDVLLLQKPNNRSFSDKSQLHLTTEEQKDIPKIRRQITISHFEQFDPISEIMMGKKRINRNKSMTSNIVISQTTLEANTYPLNIKDNNLNKKSFYIPHSENFSEIINNSSNGIIPKIINDKLQFIYWEKNNDIIAGCLINKEKLIERLIKTLPDIYSQTRILTILDETENPLIMPKLKKYPNWRIPFVSLEISDILPGWKIAAYLTDPNAINAQAHTKKLFMLILIFILISSIVTGGFLIIKSLYYEINLAQQKTTFAANVSHELKTPLTSIKMFTEMLKSGRQQNPAKQNQYYEIMLSETERLTRLINNVLDFSRMDKNKRQYKLSRFDIIELTRNTLEGQKIRLKYKGFEILFKTEVVCEVIKADEEAIKQVLLNLLSNSEKYSDQIKEIEVKIKKDDSFIYLEILDRGIGISEQHAKKIFDEFYRADDSLTSKTSGTGLGLTISKRIITDHNGTISFKQRSGGGSIFEIKLPIDINNV